MRSEWKNALWRFVSQFSECDPIDLVKIYEQIQKAKKKAALKASTKIVGAVGSGNSTPTTNPGTPTTTGGVTPTRAPGSHSKEKKDRPPKDPEEIKRLKREREEKKERHRAKLKRKYEREMSGSGNRSVFSTFSRYPT